VGPAKATIAANNRPNSNSVISASGETSVQDSLTTFLLFHATKPRRLFEGAEVGWVRISLGLGSAEGEVSARIRSSGLISLFEITNIPHFSRKNKAYSQKEPHRGHRLNSHRFGAQCRGEKDSEQCAIRSHATIGP
jgi:hypothetical protein